MDTINYKGYLYVALTFQVVSKTKQPPTKFNKHPHLYIEISAPHISQSINFDHFLGVV